MTAEQPAEEGFALGLTADRLPDGSYQATLTIDGTEIKLTRRRAAGLAEAMIEAACRADHDAAMVRELVPIVSADSDNGVRAVGVALSAVRRARKALPGTPPLRFDPIVNDEWVPWVHMYLHERLVGSFTPAQAWYWAAGVLAQVHMTALDTGLSRWLTKTMDLGPGPASAVIYHLGNHLTLAPTNEAVQKLIDWLAEDRTRLYPDDKPAGEPGIGDPGGMTITPTGYMQEGMGTYGRRIPEPAPGEHLWIMTAVYRITNPAAPGGDGPMLLDRETLLSVIPVTCYSCEQPYTPERGAQPCPGDPAGPTDG